MHVVTGGGGGRGQACSCGHGQQSGTTHQPRSISAEQKWEVHGGDSTWTHCKIEVLNQLWMQAICPCPAICRLTYSNIEVAAQRTRASCLSRARMYTCNVQARRRLPVRTLADGASIRRKGVLKPPLGVPPRAPGVGAACGRHCRRVCRGYPADVAVCVLDDCVAVQPVPSIISA